MKRTIALAILSCSLLLSAAAMAQMRATIDGGPEKARGKKVILYDDGTWKYAGARSPKRRRLRDKLTAGQFWGEHGTQAGQFYFPCGMAVDAAGHIYVADKANHRIQVFTARHRYVREWKVEYNPAGVAFGPDGSLYVTTDASMGAPVVHVFDTRGKELRSWGKAGRANGQFDGQLGGVAVDGRGNVYVADTYNHRIQKFNAQGEFLTTWGSLGTGEGQFSQPFGVAVDEDGNVYVTDVMNYRIQKFTADGEFLAAWGGKGTEDGQFWSGPRAIQVDEAGTVWTVATGGGITQIQRFSADGTFLMGWGHRDNGATFDLGGVEHGLCILPAGKVYIADSVNHRIRDFKLSYDNSRGAR